MSALTQTQKTARIVKMLRAGARQTRDRVGHLMTPTEIPLEEVAANEIERLSVFSTWAPISIAPPHDDVPFLVLLPKNDVADFVVLQVTRFEGQMYPDHLNGNIDWDVRITTATHWCPIAPLPTPKKAKATRSPSPTTQPRETV